MPDDIPPPEPDEFDPFKETLPLNPDGHSLSDEVTVAFSASDGGSPSPTLTPSSDGGEVVDKQQGHLVGHYKVGREIARGGMGSILEASDTELSRTVAMKVLLLKAAATDEVSERFIREANILARLEHPNIVPIHELGTDDAGQPYYTMKMVKGKTLQDILDGICKGEEDFVQAWPLVDLLNIFRKICDAIAFAHFHQIVHRDIKPENVMVGEFGEVLVMDWGISKLLDEPDNAEARNVQPADSQPLVDGESVDLTMDGSIMGTPHYMPPEQAEGRIGDIDPQSDVFSLGGILYSILTLRRPVVGTTVHEVLDNIRTGNITPPTGYNPESGATMVPGQSDIALVHCPGRKIPAALSAVTMKALAVDKGERYPSVLNFAADIDAYLGGFATSVEDLNALGQFKLLVKRHRLASAITFGALALIAVLTTGFLIKVMQSEQLAKSNEARAVQESERATIAQAKAEAHREALRRTLTLSHFNQGVDALEEGDGAQGLAYLARALRTDGTYYPAAVRISQALQQRSWSLNLRPVIRMNQSIVDLAPAPGADRIWTVDREGSFWLRDLANPEPLIKLDNLIDPPERADQFAENPGYLPARIQFINELLAQGKTPKEAVATAMPPRAEPELVVQKEGEQLVVHPVLDLQARVFNKGETVEITKKDGTLLKVFSNMNIKVRSLRFSPDGSRMACWEDRGRIQLWEILSGKPLGVPIQRPYNIAGHFTEDGATFITNSEKGGIILWDAWNGQELRTVACQVPEGSTSSPALFLQKDAVGFVPARSARAGRGYVEGVVLPVDLRDHRAECLVETPVPEGRSIYTSRDGQVYVVRVDRHGATRLVQGWVAAPDKPPRSIALDSPPQRLLLSHSGERVVTLHGRHDLRVWEFGQSEPVWEKHSEHPLHDFALNERGTRIVAYDFEKNLKSWELGAATDTNDWVIAGVELWSGLIPASFFSPDGRYCAVLGGDDGLIVMDAQTSSRLRVYPHKMGIATPPDWTFSPSSKFLALHTESQLDLFDLASSERLAHLEERQILHVNFSPSESLLAVHFGALNNGNLKFWDWRTGHITAGPVPLRWSTKHLRFDPTGQMLAVNCSTHMQLFDVDTGRELMDARAMRLNQITPPAFSTLDGGLRIAEGGLLDLWKYWYESPEVIWNRDMTHRGNELNLISLPKTNDRIPAWFPNLAEAIGGIRMTENGGEETVPYTELARIKHERLASATQNHYHDLARWFFEDPLTRKPLGGEQVSVQAQDLSLQSIDELRTSLRARPGDALLYAELGLRMARLPPAEHWIPAVQRTKEPRLKFQWSPPAATTYDLPAEVTPLARQIIRWYDSQAAQLGPTNGQVFIKRAEMALLMNQPEKAGRLANRAAKLYPDDLEIQYQTACLLNQLDDASAYSLFRDAAFKEASISPVGHPLMLTKVFEQQRIDPEWLPRLAAEPANAEGVHFRFSTHALQASENVGMPLDLVGKMEQKEKRFFLCNRNQAARFRAYLVFQLPDEEGQVMGVHLSLNYGKAAATAPHSVNLIAPSDWDSDSLSWENQPPLQAQLAEWNPVEGPVTIPLNTRHVVEHLAPSKPLVFQVTQDSIARNEIPWFHRAHPKQPALNPHLKILRIVQEKK